MKYAWKVAVAAAVLTSSAGAAKAVSLSGPTGVFLNPTAGVAKEGAPNVGVDYLRYSNDGVHLNRVGVAGAIGISDKAEISGAFHRYSGDARFNEWNVGAKYQVLNQKSGLSVAVGADYQKQTNGGDHRTDGYVVATKPFSTSPDRAPVIGSLGLRYNSYGASNNQADVFASVMVPLTRSGELHLCGELGSKRSDAGESEYALGLHYAPTGSSYTVAAGIARDIVVVQVGYQFGK